MPAQTTHVNISPELRTRAHQLGISVTGVARRALQAEIRRIEEEEQKETGALSAKSVTPAIPTNGGNHVINT